MVEHGVTFRLTFWCAANPINTVSENGSFIFVRRQRKQNFQNISAVCTIKKYTSAKSSSYQPKVAGLSLVRRTNMFILHKSLLIKLGVCTCSKSNLFENDIKRWTRLCRSTRGVVQTFTVSINTLIVFGNLVPAVACLCCLIIVSSLFVSSLIVSLSANPQRQQSTLQPHNPFLGKNQSQ